jgi:hypothetical protein
MHNEAIRLRAHAAIISSLPAGYCSNALEVAYALARQLHLARQSICVTKYGPREFVAEFGELRERDRALCKGYIEIGGSIFPIRLSLSAGGGPERTWWYHVKVTMEHVPLEA